MFNIDLFISAHKARSFHCMPAVLRRDRLQPVKEVLAAFEYMALLTELALESHQIENESPTSTDADRAFNRELMLPRAAHLGVINESIVALQEYIGAEEKRIEAAR